MIAGGCPIHLQLWNKRVLEAGVRVRRGRRRRAGGGGVPLAYLIHQIVVEEGGNDVRVMYPLPRREKNTPLQPA
jgi:hypothetical protein